MHSPPSSSLTLPTKSTLQPMTIVPGEIPSAIHLGLTVFLTVVYTALFLVIYIQLFRLLYYQHKRLSYQTFFLFLCLIWAALRINLFAFYYKNVKLATTITRGWYFILYALPVCLQYVTLSLLVLYFCRVFLKARERADADSNRRRRYRNARVAVTVGWVLLILLMVISNIVSSMYSGNKLNMTNTHIIHFRIAITEGLFLINAFLLGFFVLGIYKTPSAVALLETQGTTLIRSTVLSALLVILFLSRAIYNIVIVSPAFKKSSYSYTWLDASDEAEDGGDEGRHYVAFGVVLLVWEILPTSVVIFFFRMRRPDTTTSSTLSPSKSSLAEPCFFDNPNRYDSDGDDVHTALLQGHRHLSTGTSSVNPGYAPGRQSSLPSPAYPNSFGQTPPFNPGLGFNVQVTTPQSNTTHSRQFAIP